MKTLTSLEMSSRAYPLEQILFRALLVLVTSILTVLYLHDLISHPSGLIGNVANLNSAYFSFETRSINAYQNADSITGGGSLPGVIVFLALVSVVILFVTSLERRRLTSVVITADGVNVEGEGRVCAPMLDAYGHVNYVATILNCHWCWLEMFKQCLTISLKDLAEIHKFAFVVAKVDVRYRRPIGPNNEMCFSGSMTVTAPSTINFVIKITAVRLDGRKDLAIIYNQTMIFISLVTGKATEIPDWVFKKPPAGSV